MEFDVEELLRKPPTATVRKVISARLVVEVEAEHPDLIEETSGFASRALMVMLADHLAGGTFMAGAAKVVQVTAHEEVTE